MIIVDFIWNNANYGKVPDNEVVFFVMYLENFYHTNFWEKPV